MMRTAYVESLLTRLTKVKAHQKQLAKAGEVGTQLHNMAEWFLRKQAGQVVGPEPPLSAEAAVSFQHFQTWVADIKLQPAFLEQTVWSTKYRYAGTLDVFGRLGKHQVVIDFKTSSALYAEYDLQVAAYVQAIREMKQGTPTHGFLVRFPKKATDTFEVREIPDWRARFKEFLKVRQMFDVWYAWERAYQEKRQAAKDAAKAAPVAPATNDGVEATF
jgi:ATP-dependent exoDNAse (exonuclease V) beta subunit